MSKSNVATPCPQYQAMEAEWDTVDALRGGTTAMRDAKTTYLPEEPKEEQDSYKRRVDRTFLFPAFSNTLRKMVEKPFTEPVRVRGEVPALIRRLLDDADLVGTDLTGIARWLFANGIAYGRSHIFVDFQNTEGRQTKQDEQTGRVRPYFVKIAAKDLISWTEAMASTGEIVITEARWKETRVEQEPNGYGSEEVERVRVIRTEEVEPGKWSGVWETHKKEEKGDDWVIDEHGEFSWPGGKGVPLFTFNPGRDCGRMDTIPPLRGLMWLNVEHWQTSSDYRSALRFAALIMLTGFGFNSDEAEAVRLGHGAFNVASQPEARLEWTEASGSSIEHLRAELDRLAEAMELEGMQPLMRKRANTTATSQASNDSQNEAPIQAWVRECNATLLESVKAAGLYLGISELPADFLIELFDDFRLMEDAPDQVEKLTAIWQSGGLALEDFLEEVQSHGYLSETHAVAELAARAAEEHGALPGMFGDPEEPGAIPDQELSTATP